MNGDLLTTFSVTELLSFHWEHDADATVAVVKRPQKCDFGVVEHDEEGRMLRYIEKPSVDYTLSIGLYAFQREAVRPHVKAGTAIDMPDLLVRIASRNQKVFCNLQDKMWLDIGRMEDYKMASTLFLEEPSIFLGDQPP